MAKATYCVVIESVNNCIKIWKEQNFKNPRGSSLLIHSSAFRNLLDETQGVEPVHIIVCAPTSPPQA